MPSPSTGRYAIHELLRQYAEAELARLLARDRAIRDAHAVYYADLCEDAVGLFALGDQIRALTTIEHDLDNIRPAWRRNVATGNATGVGKMVVGLWLIHESRGWNQAGLALFGEALKAMGDGMREPASGEARALVLAMHGAFTSMLGQVEAGAEEVASAFDGLSVPGNPVPLFFAGLLKAQTQLYLGRFTEAADVVDEAIAQAESAESDWAASRFWAAAIKNIRAFIALMTGNAEMAMRLLDQSREVLEPLGDLYYMTWNLGHRGRMASASGRLADAIDLFKQSADRATRIGFPRAMQVSLMGLGEANLAAGDLVAAEAAFLESLRVTERTGMLLEMLTTLVKVAVVFAASERPGEAVKLLATVIADPASDSQMFTEGTRINTAASAELETLRDSMDPEEYARALTDASSMSYRVLAKDLIDSIS